MGTPKNQKGFGAVEGLLILVVIAIIGRTSWYVMKANDNIDSTNDKTADTSATTPAVKKTVEKAPVKEEPKADVSDKWYLYTSKDSAYKIRLADGLKFNSYDSSSYSLTSNGFTLNDGELATVTPKTTGKDGTVGMVVSYLAKASEISPEGTKQTGFTTSSGLDVQKYYYVEQEEHEGIGRKKGEKQYDYIITKGSSALLISYSLAATQKDEVEIVEKMVKSVQL